MEYLVSVVCLAFLEVDPLTAVISHSMYVVLSRGT